jgi:serine protease Do
VVDSRGLVLTNHHVVAGGGDLALRWSDGQTLPATVHRSNPKLDLALLKVGTKPLPALAFGDSARARIGERVFAIGNPWGEPWVVTTGIISGIGRRATPAGDATLPFIRSDVQLAPGNSGGPMLNARGEVIGINAMIWGGDLSIAIPGNNARAWLDEVDGSSAPIAI